MNEQVINNIVKYSKLKKMFEKVQKHVNNNEYKEAYYKVAALLEFININILIKKFKVRLEDTSITNIIKEYMEKDSNLSMEMLSINSEYNTLDMDMIDISDIEYLLSKANYIVGYATKRYGEIFE